jgi:hypothetical protein
MAGRIPARPPLVEGVDYYCGVCSGHKIVRCPCCVWGEDEYGYCWDCKGVGEVECPGCRGGAVPIDPPRWL